MNFLRENLVFLVNFLIISFSEIACARKLYWDNIESSNFDNIFGEYLMRNSFNLKFKFLKLESFIIYILGR